MLINIMFGLGIKDTQGLLAFRREKVGFLDAIKSNDGFFQTEVLLYSRMKGLNIKEYPVTQRDRPGEESNVNPFREGCSMLKKVIGKFYEIRIKGKKI